MKKFASFCLLAAFLVAAADAHLGDTAAALTGLRNLGLPGLIYDFAADSGFVSLRPTRDFAAVLDQVKESCSRRARSDPGRYCLYFATTHRPVLAPRIDTRRGIAWADSGVFRQRVDSPVKTPELGQPSHGTILGNTFYFIANTGWDQYDDAGKKKPVGSTIRKIALE